MTHAKIEAIRQSSLSIYDSLEGRHDLFIPARELESILDNALCGLDLDYPLRTRSKVVKQKVCEALGYPVPSSFSKTQPRFPGQNFDTYVQKANNLQIWNEEISPSRRYVVVRLDEQQVVTKVRVITGDTLALYDTTGTLTQKFQAKSKRPVSQSHLVSSGDTANTRQLMQGTYSDLLPITEVFSKLRALRDTEIDNLGTDQERNRGGALHEAVSNCLDSSTPDTGQFPDVLDQLLEVKLQTAPTIDLGLVCPDSTEEVAAIPDFKHCDVRYAVFYGTLVGDAVRLNHLILATGEEFFSFFQRFEGNIKNTKIQLHLPSDFFL